MMQKEKAFSSVTSAKCKCVHAKAAGPVGLPWDNVAWEQEPILDALPYI